MLQKIVFPPLYQIQNSSYIYGKETIYEGLNFKLVLRARTKDLIMVVFFQCTFIIYTVI